MIMRTMNRLLLFLTATLFAVASVNVVAQETQKTKAGVIDKTGNFVIFPQYNFIRILSEELFSMTIDIDGKEGIVDRTGKEVLPPHYDLICEFHRGFSMVVLDGKCGFIDKTGKEIVPSKYDYTDDSICDGLVWVKLGEKYGFVDTTGRVIVPPKYDKVGSFREGLAWVRLGRKVGYIDKTGMEVIPPCYDNIGDIRKGLAPVKIGKQYGFIDKTGKIVVSPKYVDATYFSEGFSVVGGGEKEHRCGFVDMIGEEVIPCQYDLACHFSEGLAWVMVGGKHVNLVGYRFDGKWGTIDKTGKQVIPPQYDGVSDYQEGLAIVKVGEKRGVIDKTGRQVVPLKYDWVSDYQEGLAIVALGEKEGVIDKMGKQVVPPKYDWVKLSEGFAIVSIGGKKGVIDKTGKEVVPPKYDDVDFFHEGFASVKKGDRWGFIDKTGKEMVPTKYDKVGSFREGLAVVYVNSEEIALFEKNNKRVQQTWAECKNKLHNCPYNTGMIQFDSALSISFFLNPRLESITDSIVSEIKRKTSDLMDFCVLFENCDNKIQSTWKECNKQLMDYPYNVEKLQLEPVSITNFFLDPRLDAITDSIVRDLKQKTSELQDECYNDLKANRQEMFAGIYIQQHPELKSVLENLKLECRCKNYAEAELVVKIADNTVPQCTCRNDYWNLYGNLFSSRSEFDNMYNTSEQGFLDDVKLRQSLKADIQEIASMLSGLKAPKFKDGLTGKNEDIIKLLQKVQYHKGKYFYDEVVEMMFAADASMTKEWEKKGSFFSSRNEFYETYVSGDYKNVLKEKKSK